MTIEIIVNESPDGSPNGTATVRATNPQSTMSTHSPGLTMVEFTTGLQEVASALGTGLEEIRQARANEDPS